MQDQSLELSPDGSADAHRLMREHPRRWGENLYVYPVISRRSDGLSIGINLSLDEACNFNCVYCQVNRDEVRVQKQSVDLAVMQGELDDLLSQVKSGRFWEDGPFAGVDAGHRRLDNLAFAGNGEPTLCRWFEQAVAIVAAAKVRHHLGDVKIVLMTNASNLRDPGVANGLRLMEHYQGEIWAKLDAGSETAFQATNRARVSFKTLLDNLRAAGQRHELVLQSMCWRRRGGPVNQQDFEDYLDIVLQLRRDGCRLRSVQLYTVARQPAESWVSSLDDAEMDALAARFRERIPDLPAQVYYAS